MADSDTPALTGRRVTAEDLDPHGWCCEGEGCGRPFLPGDLVYGVIIGLTADAEEIEGDYRCGVCWLDGTEVRDV
jgi:hypothetical protein